MLSLPFGCVLINMKLFSWLTPPYFRYLEGESAAASISEDTYFCQQARHVGCEIYTDYELTLSVGHVGTFIFRPGATPQ